MCLAGIIPSVPNHNGRLIANGGSSMDWQGIFSFVHNPKLITPSTDMLMNWITDRQRAWPRQICGDVRP